MTEVSKIDRLVSVKGKELTLADVRAFVAEMDQAGAADSTPVNGAVTLRGRLKELRASAVRFSDR
jgi:hypothetical protein